MERPSLKLPDLSEESLTPLVQELMEHIQHLQAYIQCLEDEIKRLKEQTKRPKLRPSKMDQEAGKGEDETEELKAAGRGKKKQQKTAQLEIHETVPIQVEQVPEEATFKGYDDFVVQDLRIELHNICYRLERWQRVDGTYLIAQPPEWLGGGHYGPTVVSYILYQHYGCYVTQPLLLEQLHELGIEISSGQLNRILIENKEAFHQEKDGLLTAGLEASEYVQTDDTGARHKGKNGYCTHIGNELFTWFKSTGSKSRINFLELLRGEHTDYVINAGALAYLEEHKLRAELIERLENHGGSFADAKAWEKHLNALGILGERHRKIATEGALMGSLLAHGLPEDLTILSDDAGQFNVFEHALCWIHAERNINKIVPLNPTHAKQLNWVREQIWTLYVDLKAYKLNPSAEQKAQIEAYFDEVGRTRIEFATLQRALHRFRENKSELLLVLERPELPLHNNLSEGDIREYAKRRKISGGTRSDEGRRCRDTFLSLKKTCRKLGISFWRYLTDRITRTQAIEWLPDLIRTVAAQQPQSIPP